MGKNNREYFSRIYEWLEYQLKKRGIAKKKKSQGFSKFKHNEISEDLQ